MILEVGKKYENVNGEFVDIVAVDPNKTKDGRTVFIDNVSRSYFEDGKYFYGYRPLDLIEPAESYLSYHEVTGD